MNVELTDLLDAGVHFGHQVKRWNPKSKKFVFDHRQGISIIDLTKSHAGLQKAYDAIVEIVAKGGEILLVGTKRQAQELVREAASNTNMPFCANRWLGGTLTNWQTVTKSIAKYKKYQKMEADGSLAKLPKKEGSAIRREMERMHRNFEGIVNMDKHPAAMFIVDVKYEDIAVAEARRSKIPVIALVDTNSDPSVADIAIPGNDDAVKAIRIIIEVIVEAIEEGQSQREARMNASKAAPVETAVAEMTAAAAPAEAEEAAAAPAAEEAPAPAPEAAPAPVAEEAPAPAPVVEEAPAPAPVAAPAPAAVEEKAPEVEAPVVEEAKAEEPKAEEAPAAAEPEAEATPEAEEKKPEA